LKPGRAVVLLCSLLSVATAGAAFREPPSVIRSGNEITALAWALAGEYGPGTCSLFPLVFTVRMEDGAVSAVITSSITTVPPDQRLPEHVPFPSSYRQTGETITVVFPMEP